MSIYSIQAWFNYSQQDHPSTNQLTVSTEYVLRELIETYLDVEPSGFSTPDIVNKYLDMTCVHSKARRTVTQ